MAHASSVITRGLGHSGKIPPDRCHFSGTNAKARTPEPRKCSNARTTPSISIQPPRWRRRASTKGPEPCFAAHHVRVTSRASTYTHVFGFALAEAEPGAGRARESRSGAARVDASGAIGTRGGAMGTRAMVAGRARPAGARGAGPGSMRGHQPRERSRERSSDGEEEEEDAGWCSAETMRLARPRSISAASRRARARGNGADVGGWSRGVAPRGERSVESRGSPGVAARGRRGARHGRGRRRGRAGVHVRRARIYRARLRLSLRLRVPQQQAGPVQEVLEPDDAARAKSVEVHRAGVTSLYTQQDALHHLETFRLDRIVHAAARSAFGRAPRPFAVAPTPGPSAEGWKRRPDVTIREECLSVCK